MQIGKPRRKFLIRIIDLENWRSKNFSIYKEDGEEMELDFIFELIRKAAEERINDGK